MSVFLSNKDRGVCRREKVLKVESQWKLGSGDGEESMETSLR